MASSTSSNDLGALPPGWDTKFDPRSGRYYFINHYTKSTTWEDPRIRYQQIGKPTSKDAASKENKFPQIETTTTSGEQIPLKSYPIGTIPAPGMSSQATIETATEATAHVLQDLSNRAKAASPVPGRSTPQMGMTNSHGIVSSSGAGSHIQASPLPLARLQMEESLNGSPISQRSVLRRESHVLADISEVETTFTSQAENSVQNIGAMFPTVDEAHIRELLKKYHGSQAVVISALQVAKHPFITPGPSTIYNTPPPTRHATLPGVAQGVLAGLTMTGSLPHYYQAAAGGATNMTPLMGTRSGVVASQDVPSMSSSGYPTPRPGSAASGFDYSFYMGSPQIGQAGTLFRSFPRPHSSPKMKLRYLKSVFPTVEEYLLLDVLSNSDNNVQKAADRLVKMGYVKRDTPSAPRLHARKKEEERLAEKRTPLPKPPPIKTDIEKGELRKKMKERYEVKFDIPERILYMALESVLYDEDQANNLIQSMIEDDLKRKKSKEAAKAEEIERKKSPKPTRKALEQDRKSLHASPKHEPKKASHGKKGFSSKRHKDEVDDVPTVSRGTSTHEDKSYKSEYRGAKAKGPKPSLRKGPNDDLLLTDYVTWNGPDPDLRHGCNRSLAKGPNPELRRTRTVTAGGSTRAKGPNPAIQKGPSGVAKGSLYGQMRQAEMTSRGN